MFAVMIMKGVIAESLIKYVRLYLQSMDFQKKMYDAGTNFVSEKFQEFCQCLNIHQAMGKLVSSSPNTP